MPGRFFLIRPTSRIADCLDVQDNVPRQSPRRNLQLRQELGVLTGNGLTMVCWGMIPIGRNNIRVRPVM